MKTLISGGANLYAQRNDGFTALHVAAKNNQPKITEVLVEAMDDLGVQEVRMHLCYAERVLTENNKDVCNCEPLRTKCTDKAVGARMYTYPSSRGYDTPWLP